MKKFISLFIFILLMFPIHGNAFLGTLPFINPGPQNVISGGTIDGTPIGATTPSTGAFTGVTTSNGATGPGYIYFKEDSDNGTNTVQIIGPASTADVVQTLQAATGTVLITGTSVGREFSTLNMTNGDTQTAITEAQLLANKYITNQGDTVETDIKLVAVSYYISVVFIVSENLVMEVCPHTGELFDFDGTSLDVNDCVDMDATVGSKMVATRMLLADGSTWRWSLDTVRGVHTDTGATD